MLTQPEHALPAAASPLRRAPGALRGGEELERVGAGAGGAGAEGRSLARTLEREGVAEGRGGQEADVEAFGERGVAAAGGGEDGMEVLAGGAEGEGADAVEAVVDVKEEFRGEGGDGGGVVGSFCC